MSTFDKRPCSSTPDDHATSSSTSNSAFLGLRIADDGKSLLYGGSNRSNIVPTGGYLTKSNDFHHQVSTAPIALNFNVENYVQDPLLPPLPDYIDRLEEPSLPPLPEFCVENSLHNWRLKRMNSSILFHNRKHILGQAWPRIEIHSLQGKSEFPWIN